MTDNQVNPIVNERGGPETPVWKPVNSIVLFTFKIEDCNEDYRIKPNFNSIIKWENVIVKSTR